MLQVVHVNESELSSLSNQLNQLVNIVNAKVHLKINRLLKNDELNHLALFIAMQKNSLPFRKLSLQVNSECLKNEKFIEVLERLNRTPISSVDFIFSEDALSTSAVEEIEHNLTNHIAAMVSYPIHILKQTVNGVKPSELALTYFQYNIITNIQKRNKSPLSLENRVDAPKINIGSVDPMAKKIKLKGLIRDKKARDTSTAEYVPLEIQHIETIEQQIEQQEVVEVEVKAEMHEIQQYSDEILGYEEFNKLIYKNSVNEQTGDETITKSLYVLIKQELFANLPHAIKYVSPTAAEHLAQNLPSFVTLNKDNLPNGFILKQTSHGELVLDYDGYLENEQYNVFTPTVNELDIEPIYDIELNQEAVREWVGDEQLFKTLCTTKSYTTPKQLVNLWIKYGNHGAASFFHQLKEAAQSQPKLAEFLLNHYLIQLPQWDHLHNDQLFFKTIEKISRYEADKLTCLKKFLENTGSSQHNLCKTITAFETFWNEISIISVEHKVSAARINQANWKIPNGGNPIVYMERLLSILKNARNLADQFDLLDEISLSNYGAYYASRYEGFKTVSHSMAFDYNADRQSKKPFSKDFNLYQIDLDNIAEQFIACQKYMEYMLIVSWNNKNNKEHNKPFFLIDCSKELPNNLNLEQLKAAKLAIPFSCDKFIPPYQFYYQTEKGEIKLLMAKKPIWTDSESLYSACFRFIGMQRSGITVNSLIKEFNHFKKDFLSYINLSGELLSTLFFVSHDRYIPDQPLDDIFNSLNKASIHKNVIIESIKLLSKLYKLDIKLNQLEGLTLFSSISGMNSAEFEGLKISKNECIKKLLTQLESNKFAAFKFLNSRSQNCDPKWPFLYALDTAEVLSQDSMVAATYHDDLLLFAGLINSQDDEVYFHARYENPKPKDEKKARQIKGNLEQVTQYLHQAAIQENPNNLQYAIQVLLNSKSFFSYQQFLNACSEIKKITSFDNKQVDDILAKHGFKVSATLPEIFTKDNADLKEIMILLIVKLIETKNAHEDNVSVVDSSMLAENLAALSIPELQVRLQKAWKEAGTLLSIVGQLFLKRILAMAKELAIKSAFNLPKSKGLLKTVGENIVKLPDFQDYSDFEKVSTIASEAENIADLIKRILNNPYLLENENNFISVFSKIDFSKIDYEIFYSVLMLLTNMPQRNYLSLLNTIFTSRDFVSNKKQVLELLDLLSSLNNSCFPAEYLDAFSKFVIANAGQPINVICNQVITIFDNDNKDPLLELIMFHSEFTYTQVTQILNLCDGISSYRDKISLFFSDLAKNNQLSPVLESLPGSKMVLEIIAMGHALNHENKKDSQNIPYTELATILSDLSKTELEQLYKFYTATPVSAACLFHALKKEQKHENFAQFLLEFEKAPFGERNLVTQFSIDDVERVINESQDMLNGSVYPLQYRKQLMEAFLFVNEIGEHIPAYYDKPAKNLTNEEIQSFFSDLKAKKIPYVTPFQSRLLALGLLREAMYRSTGQFPYSTQVISLIDGMMHQGDFISNIDPGQGKSLTDSMKAALLWLDSDRVDITTSSLVDARRDIANYGPFLALLGITYSDAPINSTSTVKNFKLNGINFSTFAQLSLFFAKAKVLNTELDDSNTIISLVANESDHAILDDRVIYRFATPDSSSLNYGQEWIYYALNEFVTLPEYITNDKATARDDIDDLKSYLRIKALELKKSAKIVNKFSDDQYLSWLESALMVNFVLSENEDYVIPDEYEKKVINGRDVRTRVVKVLMKDKKVSPDSTFGNGLQQLLYAKMNAAIGREEFIIEPQNKTIVSSNNKNLIDYYRSRKGFIWGSSGSVGSRREIEEQYRKYGFEFSEGEPHQKNQVKVNKPIVEKDEAAQFGRLISKLTAGKPTRSTSPSIVFCKDINTAKRLFKALETQNKKQFPMQLYTGLGNEEECIRQAALPAMITITTSALGRNTDIHYDRIQGLRVWHTFIDSIRGNIQKSGRTGRQGSVGQIHYILNAQDQHGKTVEQIQLELDNIGTIERSVNEELNNILGYLLTEVDKFEDRQFNKGKSAFLREHWAKFSSDSESHYREIRRNADYDQALFIKHTINGFNQMMAEALSVPSSAIHPETVVSKLVYKYPQKQSYKPCPAPVKLADCAPPLLAAYHILGVGKAETAPTQTKSDVKKRLAGLFNRIRKGDFVVGNREYIQYLNENSVSKSEIVNAHKEFITEFLQAQHQKPNILQRWLGFEGKLNKIAKNDNYLLMFHAFASMPNQLGNDVEVIKQSVNQLLDEYLEISWFINTNRRTWAQSLKLSVSRATDIEAIIRLLSESQVEVAGKDIAENKNRLLNSLHFFGHSRYQTTLSRAISLASALVGKTELDVLTNGLVPLMTEVTDKKPMDRLALDELKNKANTNKTDRPNASVISQALEAAINVTNRKEPEGMLGRTSMFSRPQSNVETEKQEPAQIVFE